MSTDDVIKIKKIKDEKVVGRPMGDSSTDSNGVLVDKNDFVMMVWIVSEI